MGAHEQRKIHGLAQAEAGGNHMLGHVAKHEQRVLQRREYPRLAPVHRFPARQRKRELLFLVQARQKAVGRPVKEAFVQLHAQTVRPHVYVDPGLALRQRIALRFHHGAARPPNFWGPTSKSASDMVRRSGLG